MRAPSGSFGGLYKPALISLFILVCMGFLGSSGVAGLNEALDCRTLTNNPDVNSLICAIDPREWWGKPVGEVLPFLSAN